MGLIPEVRCRRCQEVYSSLRSRCPYCGTRKVSQSARVPAPTPGTVSGTEANMRASSNTKWQIIFGLILVVAVLLSVVVMVSTSASAKDGSGTATIKPTPTPDTEDVAPGAPVVEAAPTPTPTPPPTIDDIKIRYVETVKTEFTMHVGDEIQVNAFVTPATITDKVTWSVGDEEYLSFKVDPENGNNVTLTCLKSIGGGIKLFATLGDKTAECIVYCIP